MAYDDALAERIRALVAGRPGVSEQAMFGGVAFLLNGKIFVGVITTQLLARTGPEGYTAALQRPGAGPMTFTGRPFRGFVLVARDALRRTTTLRGWIDRALAFVVTLPAKPPRPRKPRQRLR